MAIQSIFSPLASSIFQPLLKCFASPSNEKARKCSWCCEGYKSKYCKMFSAKNAWWSWRWQTASRLSSGSSSQFYTFLKCVWKLRGKHGENNGTNHRDFLSPRQFFMGHLQVKTVVSTSDLLVCHLLFQILDWGSTRCTRARFLVYFSRQSSLITVPHPPRQRCTHWVQNTKSASLKDWSLLKYVNVYWQSLDWIQSQAAPTKGNPDQFRFSGYNRITVGSPRLKNRVWNPHWLLPQGGQKSKLWYAGADFVNTTLPREKRKTKQSLFVAHLVQRAVGRADCTFPTDPTDGGPSYCLFASHPIDG